MTSLTALHYEAGRPEQDLRLSETRLKEISAAQRLQGPFGSSREASPSKTRRYYGKHAERSPMNRDVEEWEYGDRAQDDRTSSGKGRESGARIKAVK